MLSIYDYLIIGVYLSFLASMGWVFRRFNRGTKDYFAGGFRMTWWLLGASSFASNFSCWTFTGAANIAYTYGFLIFGVYVIDIVGFIISIVWFAPRFRQLRLVTAVDAIRLRFGRVTEQIFNWLGFVITLGVGAVWMVGLSILLASALDLPQVPVICLTGAVVVIIALLGGNWAVAASDFVQLLMIMSVTVVVAVLTLLEVGGMKAFLAQIPESHWEVFKPAGSIPYDWIYLVTALFAVAYQKNNVSYASKYIAAKDGRHARLSACVPLVGYCIMPLFWFVPPLAAFTLVPGLMESSSMKIPGEASYIAVCLKVLPQGLLGLMIAAMFSATIASMDVALNKNAGFFVKNFYQPILRPHASDRELFVVGEFATLCFGALITGCALLLVLAPDLTLFDAFLYLNAYLGMPLAIPLFLAMLVKRTPPWAAWGTALFGVLLTLFFFNFMPSAPGKALFADLLGERLYAYACTNRFVITNLVCVPLTALFFLSTKRFYDEAQESDYARHEKTFFERMNTPVDFEKEVGEDNTAAQARIIGRISAGYGCFVASLVLIPNPTSGRLGILCCALPLIVVGGILMRYAKRLDSAATKTAIDAPTVT